MKNKIKNISNSKILFKNGEVIDILTGKKNNVDIVIESGRISHIGNIDVSDDIEVIDCKNKIITQSFVDINSTFKSPGTNDDENLLSGSYAALAGGYTKVCLMPNTSPVIDNSELVEYIKNESENLPVSILPIGAVTKGLKGQDIAEIGSMYNLSLIHI